MTRQALHSMLLVRTLVRVLAFSFALAFTLTGCGGDKKAKPTGPAPAAKGAFEQSNAVGQSQVAALQAVALVQSMGTLARGFGKNADGFGRNADDGYGWNPDTNRWEWHYIWNQAGYSYDWLYTVEYRNAAGEPQQNTLGAARAVHSMTGTGVYAYEGGGASVDYDYQYTYGVTLAGLDTANRLMTGGGRWDIDYSYRSGTYNQSTSYVVQWEAASPGISFAPGGGCPTGTIRYVFSPYTMKLVFNGGSTAVATLYDGAGHPVVAGGRSYTLSCAAE